MIFPPSDGFRSAPPPPSWSACADEPLVSRHPHPSHPPPIAHRDSPLLSPLPGSPPPAFEHGQPPATFHRRHVSREERTALRQPAYVVRCVHCDAFFTDRGMKAVLLLKPHVTLFSTDAMPSNCAVLYAPEPLLGDVADPSGARKQRTCHCLTQTLACQGCGSVVGYNVVSPCSRCSSNVSKHSRDHNGHRIVFHCADIAAHERRYFPGDRGVRCMSVPPILASLMKEKAQIDDRLRWMLHEATEEPERCPDHDSVDPEEEAHVAQWAVWNSPRGPEFVALGERRRLIQQEMRTIYARLLQEYQAGARMILAGETVYWSDLSETGGERTQPFDPEPLLSHPMAGR